MAKTAGAKAKAKAKTAAGKAKAAKPNKLAKAAKPNPPKANAPKASVPKVSASGGLIAVVDRLSAGAPRLTETQRDAFHGQFTDAQCDDAGGRTKSALVYGEAVAWAVIIDRELREHAVVLRRYTRLRFAWFLECLRALADAIETQRASEGRAGSARVSVDKARAAGLATREELGEALTILAGGDATKRDAVAAAEGTAKTNDDLAASLRAQADLAKQWLQRFDAASQALVQSVNLTHEDVEAALDGAAELTTTTTDRALTPRRAARDTPEVNLAEGRVLLEMRLAMRVFAAAHERTKLCPLLVPGPGTRAVLVHHAKSAKPGAPAGAAPGAAAAVAAS